MACAICKLPRAGLGNQLFPLMKAYVFSQLTNSDLIILNKRKFFLGPFIRKEKSKRFYWNIFVDKSSLSKKIFRYVQYKTIAQIVEEPSLQLEHYTLNTFYVFSQIPSWKDYFNELREVREQVINSIPKLISPHILSIVENSEKPCIGVHVRLGDFKKLQSEENFKNAGLTRTPESYFINVIQSIRQIAQKNLPVTIFTDGFPHEIPLLSELPNLSFSQTNSDMADLLLLSKSKIIITSAGSTFSGWAGFISDSPIILHPDHINSPIRNTYKQQNLFEGSFEERTKELECYIRNL